MEKLLQNAVRTRPRVRTEGPWIPVPSRSPDERRLPHNQDDQREVVPLGLAPAMLMH
jgi:hypothetical protein